MFSSPPIQWINKYFKAHQWRTSFVFVSSILEPIMYLIPLFISADIVGILVTGGGWTEVWRLFRILIPVSLIQVTFFFFTSFVNEILAHRMTTDMTYDLFEELQGRSLSYHNGKDVGDIMARATNDTRTINMGLSPGIRMVLALFSIWFVGLYIIYITLSPILFGLGLLTLAGFLYATNIYGRHLEPLSTKVLEELARVSSTTTDSLVGIRDIKGYTAEPLFKAKFTREATKQALSKEKEGQTGAWFYPNLIVRIYILIILGISLSMVFNGLISIRDLVLITSVMAVVSGMSEEMNWVSFLMVGSIAAANRLYKYISEEDQYRIRDGSVVFSNHSASIEFDNVSFSFPNSEVFVLDHVNFLLNDEETLAIVGSPGSGKTTLTKLIQRLYLPTSGTIRIGEVPIDQFTNSSLRENIATVEQDIHLFNDTVLENIRFGKSNCDQEEVIHVAKIAHAHEFISALPDGYETVIGEDGVRLSGGQQQRLAIARALMINPEILILDDGASALDAQTEIEIQNAISEILKTRTTVLTTHRLAIISQADKILILDKGKVVGFGSHDDLIMSNLFYRQLFDRHFELPPMEELV